LRRRDTATHRFLFNYNLVPAEWGGVTIPPAGVLWSAR
jgi:beta-galactosidase